MARRKTPLEVMAARSPDGSTPGKRNLPVPVRHRPDYSVPQPAVPLSGRALEEWEKIWSAGHWLQRDQDYHWVEMIAQSYADIEVFRKEVEETGHIVKGYAGQVVANPLIKEIRACEATIQKCLSILGFSPTDRARLNLTAVKTENELQRMLKEGV